MKKIIVGLLAGAFTQFANAEEITFINTTDAVAHIDYTTCDAYIPPKPLNGDPPPIPEKWNLNVPPRTTIVFYHCSIGAATTIKIQQYSGPNIGSHCYYMPPNSQVGNCEILGDTVRLKWPDVNVDYPKLQNNILTVINDFNTTRGDGLTLIPNVIPLNQAKLDAEKIEKWSLQFSYDASRYPLFNGANCLANPSSAACTGSKPILAGLLKSVKAIPEVSDNFTLPTGGIWAYNVGSSKAGTPVEYSAYPADTGGTPALDGPIAVAELAVNGKSTFYQGMIDTLLRYDLSKNTPGSTKNAPNFLASTSPYFHGSLALLTQAILVGNGSLENARTIPKDSEDNKKTGISKKQFMANYAAWANPNFLSTYTITNRANEKKDALRVIFSAKNAPTYGDSWANAGASPTVSEGMAYGLLIAYAADDQERFNQLLNFILFEADTQGCSGMANKTDCGVKTRYLMPWIVDQTGAPFHYTVGFESKPQDAPLTSGSATDADINIAWALKLAAKATGWNPYTYKYGPDKTDEMDYATLAKNMQVEIARYDVNKDVSLFGKTNLSELYGPGSQWNTAGREVLYPGYDAPQAFDALSTK